MRGLFKDLAAAGILGINRRNAHYISQFNPRANFPLVDDKLRTKALCASHGIPTPVLYGSIGAHGSLTRDLLSIIGDHTSFVIKPAHGAMGNGVLVITGREGEDYVRSSGALMNLRDMRYYVSSILSGMYSLGGRVDRAIIEHRVEIHQTFERISYGGVPDCRVVVFRGVPVMAMLRLPTRISQGRANLHQGAVAAGVDIATGITRHAVHLDRPVLLHPDNQEPVQGVQVPFWDEILHMAAVSADMTGLGYIGVDVVIDRNEGPLLLELNARPGLSIQIATRAGLTPLLDTVENRDLSGRSAWDRVALAKELFARHVPNEVGPAPDGSSADA